MADEQPEVILQRMEETRTSLSEKLDELEQKVVGVMGGATEAVTDTVESVQASVESVKGAMEDTVQAVRSAFDIRGHFEHNPWMAFGGAVLVGFLGGRLIGAGARAVRSSLPHGPGLTGAHTPTATAAPPPPTYHPATSEPTPAASKGSGKSFLDSLLEGPLGEAADQMKGLAVGALMGLFRDLAADNLPESIGKSISETVDELTTKLGGKKLPAHALGDFHQTNGSGEGRPEETDRKDRAFGAPLPAEEKDDTASEGKGKKPAKAGRR